MDKLNEIMEWKRREIADRIRVVEDSELAEFGATRPQGRFHSIISFNLSILGVLEQ